jgi:hypothetical protein
MLKEATLGEVGETFTETESEGKLKKNTEAEAGGGSVNVQVGSVGSVGVRPQKSEISISEVQGVQALAGCSVQGDQSSGISGSGADADRGGEAPLKNQLRDVQRVALDVERVVGDGQLTDWRLLIGSVDVIHEHPRLILKALSEKNEFAEEQIVERAMIWAKELLPQRLCVDETNAHPDAARQCRRDLASFENRFRDGWHKARGEGVVRVVQITQELAVECNSMRGARWNDFGRLWSYRVKKYLGAAYQPARAGPQASKS